LRQHAFAAVPDQLLQPRRARACRRRRLPPQGVPDGSNWFEALVTDRTTGEVIVGGWRVGRDAVINVLPDSGRFNGNNNNLQFDGIAYVAPSYLTPASGVSIVAHAKFIHGNSTY